MLFCCDGIFFEAVSLEMFSTSLVDHGAAINMYFHKGISTIYPSTVWTRVENSIRAWLLVGIEVY